MTIESEDGRPVIAVRRRAKDGASSSTLEIACACVLGIVWHDIDDLRNGDLGRGSSDDYDTQWCCVDIDVGLKCSSSDHRDCYECYSSLLMGLQEQYQLDDSYYEPQEGHVIALVEGLRAIDKKWTVA